MYELPTVSKPMSGKVSLQVNGYDIPSWMLGELTPNVAPEIRSSERLSGTTSRPSGNLDNPSYDIVFYPNDWADLSVFAPTGYNAPTSGAQELGNFILGGGSCMSNDPVPVNIHPECNDTDDQDAHIFAALISIELSQAYTATDDMSVMIHIYPQPTSEGTIRLGTGDLSQPSVYDAETSETVPATS